MCGVTGFITKQVRNVGAKDRRDYMRQTLIVDSLRGFHGTGVFYAGKPDTGAGWAKSCEHGTDFVNSKNYMEVEADMHNQRFVVGHNRWATTGAADDVANTHPFCEEDITLVHNGTLDGDGGLLTSQIVLDVDVDSHAICHNLAVHDAKDVIERLDGAFTLIWHDRRDDSLNFVRNDERPLVMWIPNEKSFADTIYFGSEKMMMQWIMTRNHIPQVAGEFVDLPVGQHWKFLPGTLVPIVETYTLAPTYNWNNYYNDRGYGNNVNYGRSTTVKKNLPSPSGNSSTNVTGARGIGNKPVITVPATGVSDAVNAVLTKEGFDRTDRLPFLPTSVYGSMVVGVVEHLDTPCFVTGITTSSAQACFDKRWTIRPTGIRRMPNTNTGEIEVVVMAKVVQLHYNDTMWAWGKAWEADTEQTTVCKKDEREQTELFQEDDIPFDFHPHNVHSVYPIGIKGLGTRADWYDSTKQGCAMCEYLPPLHTAEHLTWLDDNKGSFVCVGCFTATNHLT